MADRPINALALAIANWGVRIGAVDLDKLPGLWQHDTDPMDHWGPLHVEINAHSHDIGGVGPFTFIVHPLNNPLAFVAAVTPYEGSMISSGPLPSGLEDRLIAHFDGLAIT